LVSSSQGNDIGNANMHAVTHAENACRNAALNSANVTRIKMEFNLKKAVLVFANPNLTGM